MKLSATCDWGGLEQGTKKTRRWLMGGLIVSIHSEGGNVGLGVGFHGGPPKMSLYEGQGMADSCVTGKPGSVNSLENLGMNRDWHKQVIGGDCYWGLAVPIEPP